MRIAGAILALAAAALFASAPGQARKSATPVDWSRVVATTTEGGVRMGNSAARVKLVEYGSLACPHCRKFEETGYKPLVQRYVRTGQVSYEFRNLLINGPDISISLLARCARPAKFFAMSEFVFATQPQWQKRLAEMSDADKAEIGNMTDQQRIARFAQIAGFGPIAARFGVTPARAKQCLADPKGMQRLLDMTKGAVDAGINRTPTFLINGKVTDAATWGDLEPQLTAALGGRD